MARRQPLRWFLVVQLDGTEDMVQARDHTQAKLKVTKYQADTGRWWGYPMVRSCRLIKGMNSCAS